MIILRAVIVPTHLILSTDTVMLIQYRYGIVTVTKAFFSVYISKITDLKLPVELYLKNTFISL